MVFPDDTGTVQGWSRQFLGYIAPQQIRLKEILSD